MSALQRYILRLLPNEGRFFDYLEGIAANLEGGAQAFSALSSQVGPEEFRIISAAVKEAETRGDDLARAMHDALDGTYVTPLDREDLHALTAGLEAVLDSMEGAASRFALFGVSQPTEPMARLIDLIVHAVEEINLVIPQLRDLQANTDFQRHVSRVDQLEHDADTVYRRALAELFASPPKEAADLIRQKDLLETLEHTIDLAASVMSQVRAVSIKNS